MHSCQVVVVEDEADLGELVVETLSLELDCDVRLISTGTAAMEWLQSDLARVTAPILMVLDIQLPGVSGLEILDFVKSQDCFRDTCIIMTSSDAVLLERARDKANWLLLKPATFSHYVEIARWFKASMDRSTGRESVPHQPAR